MRRALPDYPPCHICGKENSHGLRVVYYREDDFVVADFIVPETYEGYKGYMHGGSIASVLDEALGRVVTSFKKVFVVTGELNIKYHNPLPTGSQVHVQAEIQKGQREHGRFWIASGKMTDLAGKTLYASSTGKFFPVSKSRSNEILSTLKLQGTDRPVTMDDV